MFGHRVSWEGAFASPTVLLVGPLHSSILDGARSVDGAAFISLHSWGVRTSWVNAAAAGLEPGPSLGGNWGKFPSFYPLLSTRGQILGLISLVATAVVSPLGRPGTSIPSGMHSFIYVPSRMLGEWAS